LTGDIQWGATVGTSVWGSQFDYDFGIYSLFQEYDDYIGFHATMEINMERDGPVQFTIGSDDSASLYLDDNLLIEDWGSHSYREKSVITFLGRGFHILNLYYYEVTGSARVSFSCDPDVLMWNS
jgi:hypothetical protein